MLHDQMTKDKSIVDRLAAQMIAALSANEIGKDRTWRPPWRRSDIGLPINALTQAAYSGINFVILQIAMINRGHALNRWCTFKQALSIGCAPRKGEHGITLVRWGTWDKKVAPYVDSKGQYQETEEVPYTKAFTVFNVEQLDTPPTEWMQHLYHEPPPPDTSWHMATDMAERCGANFTFAGQRAFYSPAHDLITVPPISEFRAVNPSEDAARDHQTATLLHELVHWTGHPKRLNRDFGKSFGDQAYAFEELVAEFGSAFLCAHLKLKSNLQHLEYLAHWKAILKDNPRALLTSTRLARLAYEWILEHGTTQEEAE